MPVYEYKCESCNYKFEKLQSFNDEPEKLCPKCGGAVKKLISRSSFVLKGTGWYSTDYKSSSTSSSSGCSSCSATSCSTCS
ncbi:MAG: FmdB family zinc ribbon protein [candidate division WOR-3 bacterium]